MDVHIWREVGIICGAITGSGAVLVLGHKYIARPLWDKFGALRRFCIKAVRAVDELLPNGGGSIRDNSGTVSGTVWTNPGVTELPGRDVFGVAAG